MTEQTTVSAPEVRQRRLTWPRLVGLLVVFALLPSFISVFVLNARAEFTFPDQKSVTDHLIAAGISMLVAVLAVTWLRWWPAVVHEQNRTRLWVWIVPGTFLVVSIALLDYSRARTPFHRLGRPADVLVLPDGSLLVSDDYRGAVYRLTYRSGS